MVNPFMHRVVDEVHGVADIVEHASVGHDQVAVFESLLDAGRGEGQRSFNPEIDQATISAALEPAGNRPRSWTGPGPGPGHWQEDSLCVSAASGEDVHEAGVDVRLCKEKVRVFKNASSLVCEETSFQPERLKSVLRM